MRNWTDGTPDWQRRPRNPLDSKQWVCLTLRQQSNCSVNMARTHYMLQSNTSSEGGLIRFGVGSPNRRVNLGSSKKQGSEERSRIGSRRFDSLHAYRFELTQVEKKQSEVESSLSRCTQRGNRRELRRKERSRSAGNGPATCQQHACTSACTLHISLPRRSHDGHFPWPAMAEEWPTSWW